MARIRDSGAQPGNTNATKGAEWTRAIRRALARKYGSVDNGLLALAGKMVDQADEGDRWCLEEVGNRFDGKPTQRQELTGKDGENLFQPELKKSDELEPQINPKLRLVKG